MKYVLDTNVVSAFMRGDPEVVRRLSAVSSADVGVPQPAFAEIEYGLQRLGPSRRQSLLRERLRLALSALPRVLWTDEVSERFGVVKAQLEKRGRRIEDFDLAIAAHALAEGAILVTANRDDMERVPGLVVEDWSLPASR